MSVPGPPVRSHPATEPISVGFDAHVLDGRFQGSRTVVTRLARALAAGHSDIDVTLYSASPTDIDPRIQHGELPMMGAWRRLFVELPKICRRDRLRVLIYQYICAPWSPRSWVFIHDILPVTHARLFSPVFVVRSAVLFVLSMIWAHRVIVGSQYTENSIRKILPFVAGKLTVVRYGPSFEEEVYFEDVPVSTGAPYILAVGRLEKRKNIDLLVRAFASAGLHGVDLNIVGKSEGGYDVSLDTPGVRHFESIDDAALIELYRRASLVVYPSSAEGFGLPLLDAVLFGAPTLSSNLTAMPEVGGDLAEYFDPSAADAEATLAQRIRDHFGDRPIKTPSLEARRAHAERFSWTTSAGDLASAVGQFS